MYHEHPIKILRYSIKNLWLLVFPLLRSVQLFPFSADALYHWFVGSWFDLMVCAGILLIACLRWYCCRFQLNQQMIEYHSGIFIRREIHIPYHAITCATEEHPFFLKPFHIIRIQLDTSAGRIPMTDMSIIVRKRNLSVLRRVVPMLQERLSPSTPYRPHALLIFLFSFLFSSSLSGTVYLITLFIQAGRIYTDIAKQLQMDQMLEQITDTAINTFQHIPKIVVLLCVILALLWLLSFTANLTRYGRFRVRIDKDVLSVHMGIFNRRRIHLRRGSVNFVDIRQNLLMKLSGVESVHIACPGYGNSRRSLPVLIPIATKKEMPIPLSVLMKHVTDDEPAHKVHGRITAFWNFLWQPVTGIAALFLVRILANTFFPAFQRITFFMCILILIPLIWFFIIRIVSIRAEYIAVYQGQIQLHYSSGFTFHTITAPCSHVIAFKIRKTPFSMKSDICNFYLSLSGQSTKTHRITGISLRTAERLMQEIIQQQS